MKTPDGYFVLDAALVDSLKQKRGVANADLEAGGIDKRLRAKLRKGRKVQWATVMKLLDVLRLEPDDIIVRRLVYGDSSRSEPDNAVCLKSWAADGTPSEWKTAGNGLQYRIQMLSHLYTENKRGRGKCYDLSQFDDPARNRIAAALTRHHDVLQKLKRRHAFPCQADCGYSDENHFWVIDDHEEGQTLTEYLNREELLGGGLPFEETLDIMKQTARALLELHEREVIRRELTPDAILIESDGHVLLIDLELCKLLGEHPTVVPGKLPPSTWLAPELGGMPNDEFANASDWGKVDVYSWGKIFLYAATGRVPPLRLRVRDTELPGYPKGLRHLLANATFAGYRSRPSVAQALGVLLDTRGSGGNEHQAG